MTQPRRELVANADGRSSRLSKAEACVRELDTRASQAGFLELSPTRTTLIRALRNHLTLRVADAFEEKRSVWLDTRDSVRAFASRFLKWAPRARIGSPPRPSVLFVPRQWNHYRDVKPVCERLLTEGRISPVWLVFQPAHLCHARETAVEAIVARQIAKRDLFGHTRLLADLARLSKKLGATNPPDGLSTEAWSDTLSVAKRYLPSQVPAALLAATAVEAAFETVRPSAVVVSHPCTLEAVVVSEYARARSIPVVCVQPSRLSATDPTWWAGSVDRICAWGDESRKALIARGFDARSIEITGPVWTDSVPSGSVSNQAGKRRILVALSGPGHSVSHREHERLVERILTASRKLQQFELEYRLHPKDSEETWHRLMQSVSGSQGQVAPNAPDRETIESRLSQAAVLVTVGSTAAVDAMYAGVPVVSIAQEGQVTPEFAVAGATTHVGPNDDLAAAIASTATTPNPRRQQAAEGYLERLLGPRDGRAHERIAACITAVALRGVSQ
jgi:hypothetical protein